MSKEFQIRDGNLIASFDLENEDGDIDFCKLLKVSKGVADEIGMFVDYVATNKIIKDQSNKIADLETKLAESEKKNFELVSKLNLKEHKPAFCTLAGRDCEALGQVEELKQQLALKENTITNLVEDNRASQEWYKKQLAEKEKENELMAKTLKMTKFVEKEVIQDKISFAVEQLEKAKDSFFDIANGWWLCFRDGTQYMTHDELEGCMREIFDNQIKQLKGDEVV